MKGSINFFDEFFRDSLGCTFAELFPNTDSKSCSHYYSESSVMDSTGHVETVVNDNGKVKRKFRQFKEKLSVYRDCKAH